MNNASESTWTSFRNESSKFNNALLGWFSSYLLTTCMATITGGKTFDAVFSLILHRLTVGQNCYTVACTLSVEIAKSAEKQQNSFICQRGPPPTATTQRGA